MANDWKLTLAVDATGQDDAHVRLRPVGAGRPPYVVVRVGAVIAHCVGPSSVASGAQAWAAAQARVETGVLEFPFYNERHKPDPMQGLAVPSGSVVFDGPQPWAISTLVGAGAIVTIGCLKVHVHDRTALDVHVRAWAAASDLATKAFPGRHVPFSRLVSNARYAGLDRGLGVWQPRDDDNGLGRET
jgi:hypothetical protein